MADPWMTAEQVADYAAMKKPSLKLVPHEEPPLSEFDRRIVGRHDTVRLDMPVTDLALLRPIAETLRALALEAEVIAQRPLPHPHAVEYERERRRLILEWQAICNGAKALLREKRGK